jgi:hypothetical protein
VIDERSDGQAWAKKVTPCNDISQKAYMGAFEMVFLCWVTDSDSCYRTEQNARSASSVTDSAGPASSASPRLPSYSSSPRSSCFWR